MLVLVASVGHTSLLKWDTAGRHSITWILGTSVHLCGLFCAQLGQCLGRGVCRSGCGYEDGSITGGRTEHFANQS